jgi:hypothetical protein
MNIIIGIKDTVKHVLALAGAACALVAAPLLVDDMQAGQPVCYTLQVTNNITTATAATVATTNWLTSCTFTNLSGTAFQTNFDSLLQSQFWFEPYAIPGTGTGIGGTNGTLTFNVYASPDNIVWYSFPVAPVLTMNQIAQLNCTNVYSTVVTNLNSLGYRYFTISNVVSTVTNAYFTNSAYANSVEATNAGGICPSNGGVWGVKIFYKAQ